MKAVSRSGEFSTAETASLIANAVPFGSEYEHVSNRKMKPTEFFEKFEATKSQLDKYNGERNGMLGPFHV